MEDPKMKKVKVTVVCVLITFMLAIGAASALAMDDEYDDPDDETSNPMFILPMKVWQT